MATYRRIQRALDGLVDEQQRILARRSNHEWHLVPSTYSLAKSYQSQLKYAPAWRASTQ